MRHRVAYRKLGRVTEHRIAMLRNQSMDLLRYERIDTTVARAKELRPYVERIISIAKRSLNAPEGSQHGVTARRRVHAEIPDREVVTKLFATIAPRFVERPGGYTRMLRLGHRRGDNADVATVELIGSEFNPAAKTDGEKAAAGEKPKKKTMGERLRGALGGGRKKPETPDAGKGGGKVDKGAKGAKKVTTPRKAGGS